MADTRSFMADTRSNELIELRELIDSTHRLILTEFDSILLVMLGGGNVPDQHFIALDQALEPLIESIKQRMVDLGGINELPSVIVQDFVRLIQSGRTLYSLYLMDPNDEDVEDGIWKDGGITDGWDGITETNPDEYDVFDEVGLEHLTFTGVEAVV